MRINFSPCVWIAALVLAGNLLYAQTAPVIYIADEQVNQGQSLDLDVRVTNFNQIVSAAFAVNWDPTLLTYTGVTNIALGLSIDDNFNTMNVENGVLTYLFFDTSLNGKTLADGQVLFTIRLTAASGQDTQTPVLFGGLQEVVDTTEQALAAEFSPGMVTIGTPNAVGDIDLPSFAAQVTPNPFSGDATVLLTFAQAGEIAWVLSYTNGQQLATGKMDAIRGSQQLLLPNALFKQSGSYILKVQQGDVVLTERLVFVKP